jgi:hypothetical protein
MTGQEFKDLFPMLIKKGIESFTAIGYHVVQLINGTCGAHLSFVAQ